MKNSKNICENIKYRKIAKKNISEKKISKSITKIVVHLKEIKSEIKKLEEYNINISINIRGKTKILDKINSQLE